MSTILVQSSSYNTEQELVQEIVQLMDPETYSSLMELSDNSIAGCSGRAYAPESYSNSTGLINSSVNTHSPGGYGSYNSGTQYSESGYSLENSYNYSNHQDSYITGHSAGDYGSYNSGTEYSESGYSSKQLHSYTGLIESNYTGCSGGEHGSYNMVPSPRVPDISNPLSHTSINSEDMYGRSSMIDSEYSNQGNYSNGNPNYEANYLDISNYGPEQNNLIRSECNTPNQDMFGVFSPNTEDYTDHRIYDSTGINTCENDQIWDINDDVEFKHFIPDEDMSYLSSGIHQLQLDTSFDNAKPVRGKTRTKKPPTDVNVSSDALNVINKMIPGSGRRARCPKNWEFLMRLLANSETNPSVICWEDRENYVFRIVEQEKIIEMWNERTHKCSQTYENFARGLRYHYQKGILQPVPEKQLVYRCGPVAIQYFNNIGCS